MENKVISNIPRIAMFVDKEPYLTPFIGSLYSTLKSLGESYTYAYLLGLSGAGNRLCWLPNQWDPGNVDITNSDIYSFAPHKRVLDAIGWNREIRLIKKINDEEISKIDYSSAIKEILISIDKNIPVIAIGIIGPPECCVVFGYENEGEILIGWSYFQESENYDPNLPFKKKNWFPNLYGYILLTEKINELNIKNCALNSFKSIVNHFHQNEIRGYKVGLEAWKAMLYQLEHDDFSKCSIDFPDGKPGDKSTWNNSIKGRFLVYCDALCQIYERHNVLPYYEDLNKNMPEWSEFLKPAIDAWEECSSYGGFLWNYLSMDVDGLTKFKDPEIRKILAKEGRRCMEKDIEAIEYITKLIDKENIK